MTDLKHTNTDSEVTDFTVEELQVWGYRDEYFVEILNGEKSLQEAREDLASFRNEKCYTGTNEEYMPTNPDTKEEKK